jgi:Carboxypeptidase regulatory-like domain
MRDHYLPAAGLLILLFVAPSNAVARQTEQTGQTGVITGRVVADDGSGVSRASVKIYPVRSGLGRSPDISEVTTDVDGNFRFTDLDPGVYQFKLEQTRGYVLAPESRQEYHRLGDHVTIALIRGGVITGRITTPEGQPVAGILVSPSMVRDAGGKSVRQKFQHLCFTDDRGIYRLFGLPPGGYVVSVPEIGSFSKSTSGRSVRVYHPSSTAETAVEVTVVSGVEASGIDIQLRRDSVYAISGTVVGGDPSPYMMANVILTHVATGMETFSSARRAANGSNVFAIDGVQDGEYEIVARHNGFGNEVVLASSPKRITVKGSDVIGIELKLVPMGSISGKVVIDASPAVCENKTRFSNEEILLFSHRKDRSSQASLRYSGVDEDGEFTIAPLEAGTYRIVPQMPNENWYLRSITLEPAAPTRRAANNLSSGIALKPGNKLNGVTLAIAEGAAGLKGKIEADKGSLPTYLRVHLVPSQVSAANDQLRYAETAARDDRTFEFKNLAPGKYWLLVRAVPEPDSADRPPLPLAWNDVERAKLRKEAEAKKIEVELKSCQRVTDQKLVY